MLALIRGEVLRLTDHGVIVLAGGLGYDLKTTPATRSQLALGASVELVIYEHIREDCHQLYGFLESSAKELFELLLTVSGVGTRLALAVLEVGPENELRTAINASQVDYLTRALGLGAALSRSPDCGSQRQGQPGRRASLPASRPGQPRRGHRGSDWFGSEPRRSPAGIGRD